MARRALGERFGVIGVVVAISRADKVMDDTTFRLPDLVGPTLLATAIVIRAIKTRVEINGWNKP
jgi:hypothetical protein